MYYVSWSASEFDEVWNAWSSFQDLDFLRRKLRDTQSVIGQAGKPRPDLLIGYALMLELSDPRLKELYMLYADPYL